MQRGRGAKGDGGVYGEEGRSFRPFFLTQSIQCGCICDTTAAHHIVFRSGNYDLDAEFFFPGLNIKFVYWLRFKVTRFREERQKASLSNFAERK